MVAFALHNYIGINSTDDQMFTMLERHLGYKPHDELSNVQDSFTNNEYVRETFGEMKDICSNIVNLL